MKSNIVIFGILTVYLAVLATAYTVWNYIEHSRIEWAGTTMILLSGGLTGFIAVYLWLVQKKSGGIFVEDRLDSDIDDADPEIGDFSPWSWWPIVLAGSLALVVLGLALGGSFWVAFFAAPLVLIAIVGWVYEAYRGNFAR